MSFYSNLTFPPPPLFFFPLSSFLSLFLLYLLAHSPFPSSPRLIWSTPKISFIDPSTATPTPSSARTHNEVTTPALPVGGESIGWEGEEEGEEERKRVMMREIKERGRRMIMVIMVIMMMRMRRKKRQVIDGYVSRQIDHIYMCMPVYHRVLASCLSSLQVGLGLGHKSPDLEVVLNLLSRDTRALPLPCSNWPDGGADKAVSLPSLIRPGPQASRISKSPGRTRVCSPAGDQVPRWDGSE